jgi:hypothetical protein
MENVHLEVDTSKFKNYKGVLRFELQDDVLSIEMGDGRKFTSPMKDLSVIYRKGAGRFGNFVTMVYTLENIKTKQVLKIKEGDWYGFHGFKTDARQQMFKVIGSAPIYKASFLQKVKYIIAFATLICLIIKLISFIV